MYLEDTMLPFMCCKEVFRGHSLVEYFSIIGQGCLCCSWARLFLTRKISPSCLSKKYGKDTNLSLSLQEKNFTALKTSLFDETNTWASVQ